MKRKTLLLAIVLLCFLRSFSQEPGSRDAQLTRFLKGNIISSHDGKPVSFASMSIDGTTLGAASGIDGDYFLKIEEMHIGRQVKVTCIGYQSKSISVRSLLENSTISLTPETLVLDEVVVEGKAPTAIEILELVIQNIHLNYSQSPFNMEFYSVLTTEDTVTKKKFTLESVFSSYYEGYHKSAKKNYKMDQKRESGDYFMKEKTHGMSQWPMWEVAFNDIFSNQATYQVVTLESLEKIRPELSGFDVYDGDTVYVVNYFYQVRGTIYISAKDYAILKHVTTSSGRGFKNRSEIIYKKQDGKYFPYAANGDYQHEYKIEGTKKILKICNHTMLRRITADQVDAFANNNNLWHPKNVTYNEDWWDKNYKR
jgi:hypothetical protein